jgi:hypothetical protein
MKTSTTELKDFVKHQAAEDLSLPPGERSYQKELVADVLGQEALSDKIRDELLKLYHAEIQAA